MINIINKQIRQSPFKIEPFKASNKQAETLLVDFRGITTPCEFIFALEEREDKNNRGNILFERRFNLSEPTGITKMVLDSPIILSKNKQYYYAYYLIATVKQLQSDERLKVLLGDNSVLIGGKFEDSKFAEIDKPIKKLEYQLPKGGSLVLEGFEWYNHIIEGVQPIGSKPMVQYLYLMGKKGNNVTSYRITMFETTDSKFKIGDITVREYGKEYADKIGGWKIGYGSC